MQSYILVFEIYIYFNSFFQILSGNNIFSVNLPNVFLMDTLWVAGEGVEMCCR